MLEETNEEIHHKNQPSVYLIEKMQEKQQFELTLSSSPNKRSVQILKIKIIKINTKENHPQSMVQYDGFFSVAKYAFETAVVGNVMDSAKLI